MSKLASVLLIGLLVVSSLVMAGSIFAQSIPKPSVPEFTLQIEYHPYEVPTTYTTDPYTGTKRITSEGYVAQNRTINISIAPQQFTKYTDAEGNQVRLYCRIAYKGRYAVGWRYYPAYSGFYGNESQYFSISDSVSTIVRFGFGERKVAEYRTRYTPPSLGNIADGGKIDFKVEAFMGYCTKSEKYMSPFGETCYDIYTGESSGWSNTQTITISENQTPTPVTASATTPTPEPTQTPEQAPTPTPPSQEPAQIEFTTVTGVAFVTAVIAIGLGLLVYLIKRK